ncbi:SPNS2 [Branchiostoma lanceolatum]|uniref:SPNS2 protein n=1 Tax=Branchiostoma lanceolatum TaxID=7740 RepID=A0A8J9ZWE9_BRALA|nr:SPNS2 [Branchiostoma lanceolatum]
MEVCVPQGRITRVFTKFRGITDSPTFCLLLLSFIYILNQADKHVLPVLIPAGLRCVNSSADSRGPPDCGCITFTNLQQGLLTGPAFVLTFTLAGVPLAWWADRGSRRLLLAGGVAVWSAMVLVSAGVTDFSALLLARMGQGTSEASCNPVAYALMSELFPPESRATAFGVYHLGIYLGSAISYTLGSLTRRLCWREILRLLAFAGFTCVPAVLLWIPSRKHPVQPANPADRTPIIHNPRRLFTSAPYTTLCLAASVQNLAGYATSAWLPTFYWAEHGLTPGQFGSVVGGTLLVGGCAGSILGGAFADRLSRRNSWYKAYFVAGSLLTCLPFLLCTLKAEETRTSFLCLTFTYLFTSMWISPAAALVQDLFPADMRARASAVNIAIATILGGVLGPTLIGALVTEDSDTANPASGHSVRDALLTVLPLCYVLSSSLFLIAGVFIRMADRQETLQKVSYKDSKCQRY